MNSYLLANAITTFLCFLINSTILFIVLLRGRKRYHYLFATILALYAIGNFSFGMAMIRNSHLNELHIYASIISVRGLLMVPCIYHFTCSYLNQPRKWSTIFIWVFMIIIAITIQFGIGGNEVRMVVTHTDWGNFWTLSRDTITLIRISTVLLIGLIFIWLACWFLFRAYRQETSPLVRRHMMYILIGFLVISFFFGSFISMFLESDWLFYIFRGIITAAFGALIGIAIIKERLLDITVIIKKTTIYSILLALVIFIFSLSEHMLATYVGGIFGENSFFIHIISIAVVIAILMPIRHKIEHAIERFFAKKTIEF